MQFFKSGTGSVSENIIFLHSDWSLASAEPGAVKTPANIGDAKLEWFSAIVPGTVAQSLAAAGKWNINRTEDFDAKDWWYQCNFQTAPGSQHKFLHLDGLATLADVWLNGQHILKSDNMFVEHQIDVAEFLQATNELVICFRSLNHALVERRPRPRWKTRLVNQQQLRFFRTSLLGRIPGWSPPIAPVGPWRSISLHESISITDLNLRPSLQADEGVINFSCKVRSVETQEPVSAILLLDSNQTSLQIEKQDSELHIKGELRIPKPKLWWPHTHGTPVLNQCQLELELGDQKISVVCGNVGFRSISVDQQDGDFKLYVNGESIFCRGACWTVNDIVSLNGTEQELERCLELAKNAGMNMIRVGGTMVYEQEQFYSLCDKLGILVWQDFMFANMDYPVDDEHFRFSVENEVAQQLKRWQSHPCITVYCGNSEVEQQAAMLGMPNELWRSTLFSQLIPNLCQRFHPGIPYVPSTPNGGTLPFNVGSGITHYYGVGAYMRPVEEVRRANVRFTPECLGFSNVPEEATVNSLFDGQLPVIHHPVWKSRVPRDSGAGWDFEDIRDHYLETLFHQDPVQLRCFDIERYLGLSRITTGEMMEQVFSEWRSAYSNCGGALVWFYKDLWPGAGWGVVDSSGLTKSCYYYLKRVLQSQVVMLTDEGLDGLHLHIVNERNVSLSGTVRLMLLRDHRVVMADVSKPYEIGLRSRAVYSADELLGGFYDVNYAYRFGPLKHDVVAAQLNDSQGNTISEAFYFPGERKLLKAHGVCLDVEASRTETGDYILQLQSDAFLQAVHFDVSGYAPQDNYFHLLPGKTKQVLFRKTGDDVKRFKVYVESLNLDEPVKAIEKK